MSGPNEPQSTGDGDRSSTEGEVVDSNMKSLIEFVVGESQQNYEKEIRRSEVSAAQSRLLGVVSIGIILRFAFTLSLEVTREQSFSEVYLSYAGYQWPSALVQSVWVMFTMLTTIGFGVELALPIANVECPDNSTSLDEEFEVICLLALIAYILIGLGVVGNVIEVLRAELISDRNTYRRNRRDVALNDILRKLRHAASDKANCIAEVPPVSGVSESVRAMFSRIDIDNKGYISLRQLCAFIDQLRAQLHLYPAPFASCDVQHVQSESNDDDDDDDYGQRERDVRKLYAASTKYDTLWEAQRAWEKRSLYQPCKYFCGVYCYRGAKADLQALASEAECVNMSLEDYVRLRSEQKGALDLLVNLKTLLRSRRKLEVRRAVRQMLKPRVARPKGAEPSERGRRGNDSSTNGPEPEGFGDIELQEIHAAVGKIRGSSIPASGNAFDTSTASLDKIEASIADLSNEEQKAAIKGIKAVYRHLPNAAITVSAFETAIKHMADTGVSVKMGLAVCRRITVFVCFALVFAAILFLVRNWSYIDSLYVRVLHRVAFHLLCPHCLFGVCVISSSSKQSQPLDTVTTGALSAGKILQGRTSMAPYATTLTRWLTIFLRLATVHSLVALLATHRAAFVHHVRGVNVPSPQ